MLTTSVWRTVLALNLASIALAAGVPPSKKGQHERTEDGAFSPRDSKHHADDPAAHDANFDHEAILGSSKQAEEFDHSSEEESKKKLEELLVKMDRNGDKKISKKELHSWILRSFKSLSAEESEDRFVDSDKNKDKFVSWTEHVLEEYDLEGDDFEAQITNNPDREDEITMLHEDEVLFKAADRDGDGKLSKKEFLGFSHPEEVLDMHDTVVQQLLDKKDKNNDQQIDFQEFVGIRGQDQEKDWLIQEKERFDTELDLNKDGALDRSEILDWMIPSNEDIAMEEVNHLFAGADDDHSSELSFKEVLDHYDLFVGSEATDYGQHLKNMDRFDDEL